MTAISSRARAEQFDRLERESFDFVVIGGGITGAGIAREASLRGLSVALFEAADFAVGTSSRSSKLIHGGLRYLAMGDVATVRSTALERKVIHRLAPHLAEPHWMLVPARSRAGVLKVRAGVTTYEKLGAVEEQDLHRNWGKRELETGEPLLDRDIYKYACVYREYLTDDARLVLANLRAAAAAGACVVNYAPVKTILKQDGKACGVEAECAETGRRVRVQGRAVINATGPWVDKLRALEDDSAKPMLHLSKGVHIVLRRERLPVKNVLILNTQDRRSIFVIPRGSAVYVGTTDTTYERGYEIWPKIDHEDVTYLLEPLRRYFTVEPVEVSDVFAAWAGLRPLIAEPGKSPSEISRRDEVLVGPSGVVTIAGGKLTGYRPMARATVERAAELHALKLALAAEEDQPLPGGDIDADLDAQASRLTAETGVPAAAASRLVRMYGSEAEQVVALGAEAFCPEDPEILHGEIDWAVQHEAALHLSDVIYRRVRTAFYHPEAREVTVEPMAARMAELLGWDASQKAREVERARALLAADLRFRGEEAAA